LWWDEANRIVVADEKHARGDEARGQRWLRKNNMIETL